MIKKTNNIFIEINIIFILTFITLAEKAILLVPTIQYFIILLIFTLYLITLVSSILFKDKRESFLATFNRNINKNLIVSLVASTIMLVFAFIYGTFLMMQVKNKLYLIILLFLSISSVFSIIHYNKNIKLVNISKNKYQNLSFLVALVLIFLTIIFTYSFPNQQILRFIISLVIFIGYYLSNIYLLSGGDIDESI